MLDLILILWIFWKLAETFQGIQQSTRTRTCKSGM